MAKRDPTVGINHLNINTISYIVSQMYRAFWRKLALTPSTNTVSRFDARSWCGGPAELTFRHLL